MLNIATCDLDRYLIEQLFTLRKRDQINRPSTKVYEIGEAILKSILYLPEAEQSLQVGILHTFLADTLLAAGGESKSIQLARTHASAAFEQIMRVPVISSDITRFAVHAALLKIVSNKALGDFYSSFIEIEKTKKICKSHFLANQIDLIPLNRQHALMTQSDDEFLSLARNVSNYKDIRPAEHYATLKRIFEFLLNTQRIEYAECILKKFNQAYTKAKHLLPPISKVSYAKNIGHYLILKKQIQSGRNILMKTLITSVQLGLAGQQRQIARLLNENNNERSPILINFAVENI